MDQDKEKENDDGKGGGGTCQNQNNHIKTMSNGHKLALIFQRMGVTIWQILIWPVIKVLGMCLKQMTANARIVARPTAKKMTAWFNRWEMSMIGSMEKGVEAAKLMMPPEGVYAGVDLKVLPRYICFRAALLRERITLQYGLLLVVVLSLGYFVTSRVEIANLYTQLREKEYILAPGVQDFIPAAPQSVPERHVLAAAMDYLNQFGSINPVNITEQYQRLSESMTPALRAQFLAEAETWKQKVKVDNLSEVMTVIDKTIESDQKGKYRCVANVRTDSYVNNEHIGYRDEVIEMMMELVPPEDGKRWYLELSSLSRASRNSYQVKDKLSKGVTRE